MNIRWRTAATSLSKPVSIIGRLFQSVFFAIFFLAGLFFFGLISREVWRTVQSYRWPATPCVIESCSVTNAGNDYRLAIAYRYEVNGQSLRSDKVTLQSSGHSDYGAAQRQAAAYPVGTKTQCYVNPSNPTEAILRHDKPWIGLFILLPLVFMAVGGFGVYAAWNSKPAAPPKPVVSNRMGQWGLTAFFGLFLLVGAGAFYGIGVKPMLKIQDARQWPSVPCVVVSSDVRSHSGDDSTTYSVNILYRYEVNGREYQSNRYEFMGGSSSGYEGKAKVVARFPPGTHATCFVNPNDPTEAVMEREFTPGMLLGLLPLIFFFVGAGGVTWALTAGRQAQPVLNPAATAPWLQRADWASKRIVYSTKPTVNFALSFAVIWNLVSVPVLLVLAPEAMKPGKQLLAIGLILPVVGVLLARWAFVTWRRWQAFGDSVFELGTLPGAVGGALEGKLRLSWYLQVENGFKFRLACVNRSTTRNGNESSTSERVVWQDEQVAAIGAGDVVPLMFYIPPACRETDATNPADVVSWRVEVTARANDLDYKSQFEVPVFKVALTPEQAAAAQRAQAKERAELARYQQPARSRIVVQTAARGGKEFYFPAARNPGAAVGLAVILGIWSVAVWFLATHKAPVIFPIVFGFFELLLIYGFLQSWFGTTRVVMESGGITVMTHMLGMGRTRTIAFSDVEQIATKVGLTAGTTTYQDIKIVCRNGKQVTAGSSIRDVREAEWLAAEMAKAAGVSGK